MDELLARIKKEVDALEEQGWEEIPILVTLRDCYKFVGDVKAACEGKDNN